MEKLIVLSVIAIIATVGSSVKATHYIDLGYEFDETTLFYPGQRFSEYELYKDIQGFNFTVPDHIRYFFAMYSFCMGEHGGTHVDTPYHFNENGWKLGEIPLDRLVDVPAAVIDVEMDVFYSDDPGNFKVEVTHLLEHERKYGKIPTRSVVMFHTGWGERYWPNEEEYLGRRNNTLNFPGLSGAAARWLVKERNIVSVGIDTASADVGNFGGTPIVHLVLCGNQVYIIENLTNLRTLMRAIGQDESNGLSSSAYSHGNEATATIDGGVDARCDLRVHVMPMKTKGTGGPARVLAYCKYPSIYSKV